jgi:hypothetical protein
VSGSSSEHVGLLDEAIDLTVAVTRALVRPLGDLGRAFWDCGRSRD